MTLDQLRIFVAIAEREHVTRAAEALDVTQSSASAAVAALEREFGARLFHRVGRGIVLTECGSLLLSEARALLSRAESLALAMSEFAELGRGRLKIKASQTIASHFLPERLVDFHHAYPGIKLAVSVGNSTQVIGAILHGEVELGFIEGPEEDFRIPQLATELIAHDPLVMVAGAVHELAFRGSIEGGDLLSAAWIVREDGSGTRAIFLREIERLGIAPAALNIAIELPSNEAVLAAVLSGAGAAMLSKSVCADALQAGRLAALPVSLPPRAFYAVQHADRYRTRTVAAFLASLRAQPG